MMFELAEIIRRTALPFLVGLAYVAFFLAFGRTFFKRDRERRLLARFIIALRANLQADQCDDQARGLLIVQRNLARSFSDFPELTRGLPDLLEAYVYLHDTLPDEVFKRRYMSTKDANIRARAFTLLNFLRRENPFSSISPKPAGLLRTLHQAIEANNALLATNTLAYISEEIEQLEAVTRSQREQFQRSFIVSIVGAVLSLFFGILSFSQWVR